MDVSLDNLSPKNAAIIAAFSLRLTELTKRKKVDDSHIKLLIEDEEISVPQEVLAYLKDISNRKIREEIPLEEAIVMLDISSEEMQALMSKKAISYRKLGNDIFISRKEVEKYAERLMEKRLKGMEKLIEMQQEMGLYK